MSYYKLNNAYNNTYYKDININQYFYPYRLGDMIRSSEFRDRNDGYKWHINNFPNSIASKYMQLTDQDFNYDTLLSIINKSPYNKYEKPDNKTIVIHLRVGDVIDKEQYSVSDFLYKPLNITKRNAKISYVYNIEYYKNILKKISNNFRNIVLVYGYHKEGDHTKSEEYIDKLKQFFESNGYNVKKRMNEDADKDLVYMCNAKHFVKSGGVFSKIISEIVKLKNNKVY